ncbi:hypothetical protein [Diaphorobacter caeni]|uniref:hypothetical protein n=1 Tax=Diaphorobacter caeni TaxID=2784387 RepID=UPI00188ED5FB|nr:hypothetical protein [Diaphorobacter caeni]MBF5004231.1 hypothetical protein [Diaphorobacter caeni]
MARDGKHFFFSAISVDGSPVDAPNKRWSSRRAALHALADIAAANRRPDGAAPASPFLGLTGDLQFLADDLLIADTEPVSAGTEPELHPEPEIEPQDLPIPAVKSRARRKQPPAN